MYLESMQQSLKLYKYRVVMKSNRKKQQQKAIV